jgi:hypothetical protein
MATSRIQAAVSTPNKKNETSAWGVHEPLIVWSAPAGAEATVGLPLAGQTLSVNGAYVCLIPLAGLASTLSVHFRATLSSATATSAGPDAINLFDPFSSDTANAVVLVAGSGDGSVTTGTLQSATLAVNGSRYALYTITIASAGTAAVTVAEYTGL